MKLKLETVAKQLEEFVIYYGKPTHIETPEHMARVVEIAHRQLSKYFTEETFGKGVDIAYAQARRFPVIADFHRGMDAPEPMMTMEEFDRNRG